MTTSGYPEAQAAAMEFAEATGGETIEMTTGGRILDTVNPIMERLSPKLNKMFWEQASRYFAKGSSGEVNVLLRTGFNTEGSWATIEQPHLEQWAQTIIEHTVTP